MGLLIRFIFSKVFWINLAVAGLLIAGLLYGAIAYLHTYTQHDISVTVPDFSGLKLDELDEFVADTELRYEVVDSVYRQDKPRGTVVEQNPAPEKQVKQNRKVYLTVNAKLPEMVAVPDLLDMTERAAKDRLTSYGIKIGELIYKPDVSETVLGLERKGEEVEPGARIVKGSSLDLVIGRGKGSVYINVPNLLNLTLSEAEALLKDESLNLGAFPIEDCQTPEDSAAARVYRQKPIPGNDAIISIGEALNVWLSVDSAKLSRIPDSVLFPNQPTDTLSDDPATDPTN